MIVKLRPTAGSSDLARQASEAEERLGRLYAAIEAGTIDGTDPTLKDRVAALKAGRDKAAEALAYEEGQREPDRD